MQKVDAAQSQEERVLPVVEEVASVETVPIVTGRLRIDTKVTVRDELVTAQLRGEELRVERVRRNVTVTEVPTVREENGVTIIPVVEEVLFIEKRLVLKEELHVYRKTVEERVETPISLRKVDVTVEHEKGQPHTDRRQDL